MFSRIGAAAYKEDLTNTIAICEELRNPQQQFKSIHIAGTNGKGSVSHMLAAILQTAGYKTGLYTSPHLKDFRERIKINGEMISQDFVIGFTERMKAAAEKIEPSFFELTVGMAFDYFAKEKVDIAVIETGLGGRLDSTNIIRPELSIITNIGMDHMNLLGDTLEKIAMEKAGIIKEKVPVVIGEVLPETLPVFEKTADKKQAPFFIASYNQRVTHQEWKDHHLFLTVSRGGKVDEHSYELDLPGIYQAKNILTVLEACFQLRQQGWNITQHHIRTALQQVKKLTGLHGRWEVLRRSPLVVVDVAHNVDGINQLVQQIKLTEHKKLHIVFGTVKDKDIDAVLRMLPKTATYYFTKAQIPRALPEDELLELASRHGLTGNTFSSVNTALCAASLNAHKTDMIVVCGSIFIVGEVSMESLKAIWGTEENLEGYFNILDTVIWSMNFYR